MSVFELCILGVALSMDALAVTICNLMSYPHLSLSRRILLPITFGVFQGLMVLVGFFAGTLAVSFIETYAGPIALIILTVIGGRMIIDSVIKIRDLKKHQRKDCCPVDEEVSEDTEHASDQGKLQATDKTSTLSESSGSGAESVKTGKIKTLTLSAILFQGIATSIDALIVGVSLVALGVSIAVASPIIALTTFAVCLVGLVVGKHFGILLGDSAQIIGGAVLIIIGIKACFF